MNQKLALFSIVVRTELLKLRHTIAFWLTLIYPAGTVLLSFLFSYSMRNNKSFSILASVNNLNNVAAFFLPFYIILTISFFCHIEQKNNMFKYMLSLSVPRTSYFLGKLSASFILLAFAWLMMIILTGVSLFALNLIEPQLHLLKTADHWYVLTAISRTFFAGAAMLVLQYILAMRMRNVVGPIAIGTSLSILPIAVLFVLGVTGLISNPGVLEWLPLYNPYTYPYSHLFNFMRGPSFKLDLFPQASLIYFLIAIALALTGAYEFKKRNFK